jgi:hypothetical protein
MLFSFPLDDIIKFYQYEWQIAILPGTCQMALVKWFQPYGTCLKGRGENTGITKTRSAAE